MRSYRMLALSALGICAGFCLAPSCSDFTVTLRFVTPDKAEKSETQREDIAGGDEVNINNDIGTTRVTVDPNATQVKVEVLKTAWADTQSHAEELLDQMQVAVGSQNGIVAIDAIMPAVATSDQSDFHIQFTDDDSVDITAILGHAQVSTYRLRVTIPPGHAVTVTQGVGAVRAIGLDTDSQITAHAGAVNASACEAALKIDSDVGDVDVQNHRGSLDVSVASGATTLDVTLLRAADNVSVAAQDGDIDATFRGDVEADLLAEVQSGHVEFRPLQFDQIAIHTLRLRELDVTLNSGGGDIHLAAGNGTITIHGD